MHNMLQHFTLPEFSNWECQEFTQKMAKRPKVKKTTMERFASNDASGYSFSVSCLTDLYFWIAVHWKNAMGFFFCCSTSSGHQGLGGSLTSIVGPFVMCTVSISMLALPAASRAKTSNRKKEEKEEEKKKTAEISRRRRALKVANVSYVRYSTHNAP